MKIIETGPREIGFVLWGHCQNLLDDPRRKGHKAMHTITKTNTDPPPHTMGGT